MSDNILTLKFPHRSFSPPPKKASLVAPRSTPWNQGESGPQYLRELHTPRGTEACAAVLHAY